MEHFAKIANGFNLVNIVGKCSTFGIWQDCEYVYVMG